MHLLARSLMATELERNQSQRALAESVRCGFYFHPTDEDLSAGTPVMKKPLGGIASGYSYSGFAVANRIACAVYSGLQEFRA
jgi:hypothetical protein